MNMSETTNAVILIVASTTLVDAASMPVNQNSSAAWKIEFAAKRGHTHTICSIKHLMYAYTEHKLICLIDSILNPRLLLLNLLLLTQKIIH